MVRKRRPAHQYSKTYKSGYAPTLKAQGPPVAGAKPPSSAPGLIQGWLVEGERDGDAFTYSAGPPDDQGLIQTCTVTARSLLWGKGVRS